MIDSLARQVAGQLAATKLAESQDSASPREAGGEGRTGGYRCGRTIIAENGTAGSSPEPAGGRRSSLTSGIGCLLVEGFRDLHNGRQGLVGGWRSPNDEGVDPPQNVPAAFLMGAKGSNANREQADVDEKPTGLNPWAFPIGRLLERQSRHLARTSCALGSTMCSSCN
jgi:hypothetical protein